MTTMTDPLDGLTALQDALNKRLVQLSPCELYSDIGIHVDQPNGHQRLSYAKVVKGEIQAYSVFVLTEPLNGLPCFNLGYAVPEKFRKQGFATDIFKKSIDELKSGFGRNKVKEFYLEAVISVDNIASQKMISKLFTDAPKECIDSESGLASLAYTKLIKT
jgi:hypothetical protein